MVFDQPEPTCEALRHQLVVHFHTDYLQFTYFHTPALIVLIPGKANRLSNQSIADVNEKQTTQKTVRHVALVNQYASTLPCTLPYLHHNHDHHWYHHLATTAATLILKSGKASGCVPALDPRAARTAFTHTIAPLNQKSLANRKQINDDNDDDENDMGIMSRKALIHLQCEPTPTHRRRPRDQQQQQWMSHRHWWKTEKNENKTECVIINFSTHYRVEEEQ